MALSRAPVHDVRAAVARRGLGVALALALLLVVGLAGRSVGRFDGSTSAASARTVADVTASASTPAYAFATVLDGRPVRWPCAPVRWTVNPAGAPPGAVDVLRSAVERIAAASGTRWRYAGPTTTRPTSAVLPRSARAGYPPVVLGWTDASSDLLRGQPPSVLAMTRTAWFGVRRADGDEIAALRSAVVAFDRTDRLPLRGPLSWEAVALHELGHVMGLAHVRDPHQLMAGVLPRDRAGLQSGDLAGLHRVGPAAGCVDAPS